jgi:hypothetical protein
VEEEGVLGRREAGRDPCSQRFSLYIRIIVLFIQGATPRIVRITIHTQAGRIMHCLWKFHSGGAVVTAARVGSTIVVVRYVRGVVR